VLAALCWGNFAHAQPTQESKAEEAQNPTEPPETTSPDEPRDVEVEGSPPDEPAPSEGATASGGAPEHDLALPEPGAAPTEPQPPGVHSGTDPESIATSAGRSELPSRRSRSLAARMERAHGMAEVGLGWLTLPGAEVCVERGDNPNCTRGDSSLAVEAWQIFRLPSAVAVGGGVMLGLTPTTDAPAQSAPEVQRDHTRGYLTVEGTVRYYPYVGEALEGWLGLGGGLVIISDTFATREQSGQQKALIGPAGVIVRTEGATFGMAGGLAYEFARNWTFGGNLRMGSWFLPQEPASSPLGDEASLVGQISWFVVTVNVAYRVQL